MAIRPFIKWAGGKQSLLKHIRARVPERYGNYHEPFLGGGAVFFGLFAGVQSNLFKREKAVCHLSDVNESLIKAYLAVQHSPDELIERLRTYQKQNSKSLYLKVRDEFLNYDDDVELAAAFIFLNKTAFGGVYRVNKNGKFNVVYNHEEFSMICDADTIRGASKALKSARLRHGDFRLTLPKAGDLVYCDPPYDAAWGSYNADRFTQDDQLELRNLALSWMRSGVHVILSNSDTPFIRDIYDGENFKTFVVPVQRKIKGSKMERELLFVGRRK